MISRLEKEYIRGCRIIARIGFVSLFGAQTIPHLFPNRFFHSSKSFIQEEVKDKHSNLLQETCQKMGIDSERVKLHYVSGFSTVSAGCFYFYGNAIIGLSRTCNISNESEVQKLILFNNRPIDSKICAELFKTISLEDQELKFLLGHELAHIKNQHFSAFVLHSSGLLYTFYKLGFFFSSCLKNLSFFHRVFINLLVWSLGVFIYKTTHKYLSYYFEFEADKISSYLGKEYCDGGISYSKKRLQMNLILRKLNGLEGDKLYTDIGDTIHDITHPKRSERLKRMEIIRDELY
ncbi:transmembrane protein 177 isoform X1 [Hydra vulgaris]|uniref:transmembrane protein 177 isoform X1 n=1 Tax=Hydra vulgaris TaxID=6087 RepID=UPI0006415E9F|nr:transmembrane protein 177 [Hydra vulgaris]